VALRPYLYGVPVAFAGLISLAVVLTAFLSIARSDLQLLKAIDSEVSSLVESQDRPELLRLVKSISEERKSDFLVVQRNTVLASSRSTSEMDYPYQRPKVWKLGFGVHLAGTHLLTEVPAKRQNGPANLDAHLMVLTPLLPVIQTACWIAALVLAAGLQLGRIFASRMKQSVSSALQPVAELDQAIRALRNLENPEKIKPIGIQELDSIRVAISETQQALLNARDALAISKAKELTTRGVSTIDS
jgi:hypothetical protein